jgi:UrcA family protein
MLRSICLTLAFSAIAVAPHAQTSRNASSAVSPVDVVAQPEWPRTLTEVRVSMVGVDLSDKTSAERFYGQLKSASKRVCDSKMSDLGVKLADNRCARASLNRAVDQINQPMLSIAAGRAPPAIMVAMASH